MHGLQVLLACSASHADHHGFRRLRALRRFPKAEHLLGLRVDNDDRWSTLPGGGLLSEARVLLDGGLAEGPDVRPAVLFAAYFKNAPFMRMVNDCMLAYRSPDYDPTVSMPVRPALRGKYVIIQASHPLYTNFTAMLQRTSNPLGSHHNVQVEPCWTGCFWPGLCINKDKYAFFSFKDLVRSCFGY